MNCANGKDHRGCTPLHLAAASFAHARHLEVLQMLVKQGARRVCRTADGMTALHLLLRSPAARAAAKPPVAFCACGRIERGSMLLQPTGDSLYIYIYV